MQSPTVIYRKLGRLERELQRLKVEAYFALPPKRRPTIYPTAAILRALRNTRDVIWRKRYAKKISRLP